MDGGFGEEDGGTSESLECGDKGTEEGFGHKLKKNIKLSFGIDVYFFFYFFFNDFELSYFR